ncbi:MAG: hypothetical protein ABIS06_16170 [Vicinamibacterales bacterium]
MTFIRFGAAGHELRAWSFPTVRAWAFHPLPMMSPNDSSPVTALENADVALAPRLPPQRDFHAIHSRWRVSRVCASECAPAVVTANTRRGATSDAAVRLEVTPPFASSRSRIA